MIKCLKLILLWAAVCFGLTVQAKEAPELVRSVNSLGLDPAGAHAVSQYQVMSDIGEGLVRVNAQGELEPGVAKSWDIDIENQTFTFHLRKGLVWSDGQPITSHDFEVAWSRAIKDFPKHIFANILGRIVGAKALRDGAAGAHERLGISTPDDHTLVVSFDKLDRLFALRAHNPGLHPVPSHFLSQHGSDWHLHPDRPVNGAYRIQRIDTGDNAAVYLVANPRYWQADKVQIANVKYLITDIEPLSYGNLTSDSQQDIYGVPYDYQDSFSFHHVVGEGEYIEYQNATTNVTMLFLNRQRIDPRVVEAIKYLVDPEVLVSRRERSGALARYRFVNLRKNTTEVHNKYRIPYEQRVEKAQQLLAAAGVSRETPLKLRGVNRSEYVLPVMVRYLKTYGIDLDFREASADELRVLRRSGELDLLYVYWWVSIPDPSGFMLSVAWSGMPVLDEVDLKQFNALLGDSDAKRGEERLKILAEAESLLINQGSMIPVASALNSNLLVRRSVCDWAVSPTRIHPSMWLRWCD